MSMQKRATIISSSVAAVLTLIKFVFGILSGSVSLLASAVDSILDMFVSLFNYFAVLNSEKPANKRFNYGKAKIEALAMVIEGTIITFSGLFLLYEAIKKAVLGTSSSYLDISIYVMIISLFITSTLVFYLNYVAKVTNSMLIKADSLHYKTDILSNLAVLFSLVVVKFTGFELADVVIAMLISAYIIFCAFGFIKNGILILLDSSIDSKMVEKVEDIIKNCQNVNGFHNLKTREAANNIYLEVHIVFNPAITLLEAHKISDLIEDKIKNLDSTRTWHILIHLDPYDDELKV